MGLSFEQEALAFHLGYDPIMLQIVKDIVGGAVPRPTKHQRDEAAWPFRENAYWNYDSEMVSCLCCVIETGEKLHDVRNTGKSARRDFIRALRPMLLDMGYFAFLDEWYLSIYRTTDPYDVVRLVQPCGDFLESVDDVVAALMRWKEMFHWALLGANVSEFEIELLTMPDDVLTLAQEVHRLCPEMCDQVYGIRFYDKDEDEQDRLSAIQLADVIKTTQRVLLWWD
jgi:hypothetical protein